MADIAFLVGATMGGALWVSLFGWLFSKLHDDPSARPNTRALQRATAGYVALLLFLVFAGGAGGYGLLSGLFYLPGAMIAWALWRQKFRRDEAAEVFD